MLNPWSRASQSINVTEVYSAFILHRPSPALNPSSGMTVNML
jgi:hypothetical protein